MSIDFENDLNEAQREAVTTTEGPVLVIAGAGSGKTRTIVYRLAHLVEQGVDPAQILLLTFTRKSAQEMLARTEDILGRSLHGTSGGTFHSFAYATLRQNAMDIGFENGFTLMDRADSENICKEVRGDLKLGKGDRSYPKKSTLLDMITKSRNKELPIEAILEREAYHLNPYLEDLLQISDGYARFKRGHALVDYDDLLFLLDRLLEENEPLRNQLQTRYQYIMVDEYQDTNLVQARIVKHLAGRKGNVMAVGDDAQSIYAFRGANVANILEFPQIFEGTKIIRLEKNYRSVQPILDLTNEILKGATTKFEKHLYSDLKSDKLPEVVHPLSDQTQARLVVDQILEFKRKYLLHDVAVLFRAGYQSFPLEVALTRIGIDYQKYGGIRFHEAAHIKDVLSYIRLVLNPHDLLAWQRAMEHIKGVGPKTVTKIYTAMHTRDDKYMAKALKKHEPLKELLTELDKLRSSPPKPSAVLESILAYYQPILMEKYPDDYPKRQAGLEQLSQISVGYSDMEQFIGDLSLDGDPEDEKRKENAVVLSTVHSAKGLEWSAVIIIDLVEDRFPSRKAMQRAEDLEEERRLMYVACTRAKEHLKLFVPSSVYNRASGMSEPTLPSPFILELPDTVFDRMNESYGGGLEQRRRSIPHSPRPVVEDESPAFGSTTPKVDPSKMGFCRHKIFGKGKIIAHIEPNKYRVNFPGFGLKVIIGDYLELI
ncbi:MULTISPECIES: ATP-dependent helicase [unclassified Pseudodesulfovibrio]|uniref:ATP-dependent helicase n=1 Tax=unclassified Pseudodesulfovibrio TaxID=2661612 RepID=UPI000FEC0C58|nr:MULTISPECIES: ATP-dependent helicase [unclassified Pseudodesulfovibrio]MCJ2163719.1 ATP-dependent helicase [Pseudodesulfovibrio sp. S3-i]RWU06026.1 ATP-dependent helicase [Pseudodesulfovibrio sp. S3]